MKTYLLLLYLVNLLKYSLEIVPNWKLSGNSINLLTSSSYTYIITSLSKAHTSDYTLQVKLKKQ